MGCRLGIIAGPCAPRKLLAFALVILVLSLKINHAMAGLTALVATCCGQARPLRSRTWQFCPDAPPTGADNTTGMEPSTRSVDRPEQHHRHGQLPDGPDSGSTGFPYDIPIVSNGSFHYWQQGKNGPQTTVENIISRAAQSSSSGSDRPRSHGA